MKQKSLSSLKTVLFIIFLAVFALVGECHGQAAPVPNCQLYQTGECRFFSGGTAGLSLVVRYDLQTWWNWPGYGNIWPRMMDEHGARNGYPVDTGYVWLSEYRGGQIMTMTGTPAPPSYPPIAEARDGKLSVYWPNPPTEGRIFGRTLADFARLQSVKLDTGQNTFYVEEFTRYYIFPAGHQVIRIE